MIATTLAALGLVLLVEGLAWWLAPSLIDQLLVVLRAMPVESRRLLGCLAIVLGLIMVWVAKTLGA